MPTKPTAAKSPAASDPFHEVYDRDQVAYGLRPSNELDSYLSQCKATGQALDLGAGAGRDTLALAKAGMQVTAVDASARGLERIRQRALAAGVADGVETVHCDIRDLPIPASAYEAIVATTVLDHIPREDAERVWPRLVAGLSDNGMLYVEVHTTDDPGSPTGAGAASDAPISETARWVVNYFPPGKLLRMAAGEERLRVLRYEERLEWDYTHGPEHLHGKATLLAVVARSVPETTPPPWYGHPIAFPRRP